MAKLNAAKRKDMPAKEFAGGKPRGKPEGRFPLNDKAHIAAAESYERYATPAEKVKIDAAAKKAFSKGRKASSDPKKVGQRLAGYKSGY